MKIQGVVNASSQAEVLRGRMSKEGITHGQTVRADIPNVRIAEPNISNLADIGIFARKAPVFFCNVGSLNVREQLTPGDGDILPDEVVVKGLSVEAPGFFNVENALITSNGVITVSIDEKSRAVRVQT